MATCNQNSEKHLKKSTELTIQGFSVQLLFAPKQNPEVSATVRDILKSAYQRRQGA